MDISLPPFCRNSANPARLYEDLRQLWFWVQGELEWAKDACAYRKLPLTPLISEPDPEQVERFLNLPVLSMSKNLIRMQQIREKFDALVREYEDSETNWMSEQCIYRRLLLIEHSLFLLSVAFLDPEKREAKERSRQRESVLAMLIQSGLIKPDADVSDFNDLDFDSLFNSDDNE